MTMWLEMSIMPYSADMDMFYAAVAIRDNPSLREKPIVKFANFSFVLMIHSYESVN